MAVFCSSHNYHHFHTDSSSIIRRRIEVAIVHRGMAFYDPHIHELGVSALQMFAPHSRIRDRISLIIVNHREDLVADFLGGVDGSHDADLPRSNLLGSQ